MTLEIGEWVVTMCSDLVPEEQDFNTYVGLPCIVTGFKENGRVSLCNPLKGCWGKPALDEAPLCQLIKISSEDGEAYVREAMSRDTYDLVRRRAN
jgi:hypothetical protein